MQQIALFIYYTPSWQPLADIVLPVAEAYCERHGYAAEFIIDPEKPLIKGKDRVGYTLYTNEHLISKPVGYWKMVQLRELLDKYQLIWVLDCDTLITGNQPFTKCIPANGLVFFTEDTNGINAGSFVIISCKQTRGFIDAVISDFNAPEEQTVMKRHLQHLNYAILPHPSINSYLYTEYGLYKTHEQGQWQPGDLCLHLPGLSMERRMEIFKQVKKQL